MDKELFRQLLDKYVMETITADESRQLFQALAIPELQAEWERTIDRYFADAEFDALPSAPALRDSIQSRLQEAIRRLPQEHARRVRLYSMRKWAAAAILVLLLGAWWFLHPHPAAAPGGPVAEAHNDIAPGGNRATLTLSSGNKIDLDSAAKGSLGMQGMAAIVKTGSGQLTYQVLKDHPGLALVYNTLTTPRGGQYQLTLPDGTRVWLNAASSITFPTVFTGTERKVGITGEAYFEVAADPAKPFRVQAKEVEVDVLGTHFNINTYEDEATAKTTLLEGRVKVTGGHAIRTILPGQQVEIDRTGNRSRIVDGADLEAVMAWKNGYFHFSNASLQDLMRQIARWYDVDIVYQGTIQPRQFGGEISRNSQASDVLKILELSKVHFRIDGKKIIVMP